jgi:hypothetical protein
VGLAMNGAAAAERSRKSHVIPANAGIQEATSLAEYHPFGFDDGPRFAPPHRAPGYPLSRV